MKKAVYSVLTVLTLVTVLVACKKKDGDGGFAAGETHAATPTQACTVNSQTTIQGCNPSWYQTNTPQFINYQWNDGSGFCGCQPGYRPVMNPQWGISCAPNTWLSTFYAYGSASGYVSFNFNQVVYAAQNGQWTSIPQVTYSPAISNTYNGNNCYAQAASICDTRIANSCAQGSYCRPTSGGSYIGLCTRGDGIDQYNPQPYYPNGEGCYRWNGYQYVNVCVYGYGYKTGGGGQIPR